MTMGFSNAFVAAACLLALLCSSSSVEGERIRRVSAGARHEDHDAVHIVVNKVG